MLSGEATNTFYFIFWFDPPGTRTHDLTHSSLTHHYNTDGDDAPFYGTLPHFVLFFLIKTLRFIVVGTKANNQNLIQCNIITILSEICPKYNIKYQVNVVNLYDDN